MKKLDEYGRGRLSVLREIERFCEMQGKTATESKGENKYKNAHLAGVIDAHNRTRMLIKVKIEKLKTVSNI